MNGFLNETGRCFADHRDLLLQDINPFSDEIVSRLEFKNVITGRNAFGRQFHLIISGRLI
jgi:hypothetical protein